MSRRIKLDAYPIKHPPLLNWLRANGLNPARLLYHQTVAIDAGLLTVIEFGIDEDGHKIILDDEPATKLVTVPLISAPETHGL
jgi:hypothetical protein